MTHVRFRNLLVSYPNKSCLHVAGTCSPVYHPYMHVDKFHSHVHMYMYMEYLHVNVNVLGTRYVRVLPTLVGGGRPQPPLSLFYHHSNKFYHHSQESINAKCYI